MERVEIFHEDVTFFQIDTFENYNSFIPIEVQNLTQTVNTNIEKLYLGAVHKGRPPFF